MHCTEIGTDWLPKHESIEFASTLWGEHIFFVSSFSILAPQTTSASTFVQLSRRVMYNLIVPPAIIVLQFPHKHWVANGNGHRTLMLLREC